MAAVMVSPKYFSGRDRDTENGHKIFRLFAVLADSNQDLPLPSCSAGNGKVILRSSRTAAGILKFTGTTHVTVVTTCCSLYPGSHRGYVLQSAARQSPWLQLAAVCIQSSWLQLAAVCSQSVIVVTTCCSLLPDSHRGYNFLRSVSRQSSWLRLATVRCQTVIVVTTCCSLLPDSHRSNNLLQSVSRQSSWLQLAAVCIQTFTVVKTFASAVVSGACNGIRVQT